MIGDSMGKRAIDEMMKDHDKPSENDVTSMVSTLS